MKIIIVLLFLLPAFNICRAELTLPKLEKPAPAMQPASNEQKEQEAKPVKKEDPNKMLHEAANKMHLRGIYNALLAGADVNKRNDNDWAPIMAAAYMQNIEIIDILLEKGADINTKMENSGSYTITETDKDNIIYKFAYDQDVLTEAQNLDVIKHLIAKGYKITGKNLSTILHKATIVNDMAAIKYIVGT